MKKIQLLNKIAKVGTDLFNPAEYALGTDITSPDAVMVRSAVMLEMDFNPELLAIARCGAGVNNIPIERCSDNGVVVFNTPGANANGVKELTVAALLLASRDILGGIEWANSLKGQTGVAKLVEGGKSAFGGYEISGKTLGVIGLGAIGGMVANAAAQLGMSVIGCDPYITVEGAWGLSRLISKAANHTEIYKNSDYITMHVPASSDNKHMINAETIAQMKDGVRIINLSRADIVNTADIKEALASGKVACYVTDFPTEETLGVKGIINIPHLAASTAESEDNCAVMASHQLREFLENGNITNSVNFPNVSLPRSGERRVCIIHENIKATITRISGALSEHNINIEHFVNRSRDNNAYTIMEINGSVPEAAIEKVRRVEGVKKIFVV